MALKQVDNAGNKRAFRPNYCQVDVIARSKPCQPFAIIHTDIDVTDPWLAARTCISRGNENF
jgi:hypothetical protein